MKIYFYSALFQWLPWMEKPFSLGRVTGKEEVSIPVRTK